MNIALVRGPFLNEFEMMSYKPLMKHHDLTVYYTDFYFYDIEPIEIPTKRLRSLEGLFGNNLIRIWKYPLHIVGCYWYMIGLEDELKSADVINTAEMFNAFSYQAIKAKRKYGTKVVVSQEENIPFNHENLFLSSYFKGIVRKQADLFIAITERCKKALQIEGVPEEKIITVPHGIDLSMFKPAKKNEERLSRLGIDKNDFIILFVGRLVREKGVYDMISAFGRLVRDNALDRKRIKLLIVGSGPEKTRMLEFIHHLNIERNVTFAGVYPYEEMPEVHNLVDLLVLPSIPTSGWREQFPRVLAEAMACGKPVISTLSDSIPEEKDIGGVLVQPNDPASLYRKIKELTVDEFKRTELGKLARKRAEERYDTRIIAAKLNNAHEQL